MVSRIKKEENPILKGTDKKKKEEPYLLRYLDLTQEEYIEFMSEIETLEDERR